MTLSDLIDQLTSLAEDYPEAEIRIAMQPTWPMESGILHVRLIGTEDENIADIKRILADEALTESERGEATEELTRLEAENRSTLYFVEGSHIGYASRDLWDSAD